MVARAVIWIFWLICLMVTGSVSRGGRAGPMIVKVLLREREGNCRYAFHEAFLN